MEEFSSRVKLYWLHVGSYENIFGTGNFGDVVIYERCDRSMGSKPYQVLMNGLIHSEIAAIFDREMQNPFKRRIAIKFKKVRRTWCCVFIIFYCYSCKKKKKSWKKTVIKTMLY